MLPLICLNIRKSRTDIKHQKNIKMKHKNSKYCFHKERKACAFFVSDLASDNFMRFWEYLYIFIHTILCRIVHLSVAFFLYLMYI